jgi:hypothetical protein
MLPPTTAMSMSLAELTAFSYKNNSRSSYNNNNSALLFAAHKGRRTFAKKPTFTLPLRICTNNNNTAKSSSVIGGLSSTAPWSVPSTRTKKSVSFATTATVNTRAMSQPELVAAWIQPDEYAAIEKERRRTMEAVMAANGDMSLLNADEFCIMGLEHQLSTSAAQAAKRRIKNMQFRKLIVDEGRFQRLCGVSDPAALQSLSEIFSQQAKKRAHLRAVLDGAFQI